MVNETEMGPDPVKISGFGKKDSDPGTHTGFSLNRI
jgi:hypothetical protein